MLIIKIMAILAYCNTYYISRKKMIKVSKTALIVPEATTTTIDEY